MLLIILKNNHAFNFVEHKGSRNLYWYLNSVGSTYQEIQTSQISWIYAKKKELLKLQFIPSRVCLTSDMWTSLAFNRYIYVTTYSLGEDVNLLSCSFGCDFRFLIDSFPKEWGIEKRKISLLRIMLLTLFFMRLLVCERKFLHFLYENYFLNLIFKTGFEKANAAITKIREGVKHIKNS